MAYECVKEFEIPVIDEDGFTTDDFLIGTVWTASDSDYRLVGGEVRLENAKGTWIEVSEERLNQHFRKSET